MILGIETATEVCSTALVHHGNVVGEQSLAEKNIHSEKLLLLIDHLLRESMLSKKQLNAVAVSIGPGSFTGLRIGLSAAKGLAMALDLPLLAVPTLDAVAESFRRTTAKNDDALFCARIDAKRNEAYYAFYSIADDVRRVSEFSIASIAEIANEAQMKNAVIEQPTPCASSVALLAERRQKEFMVSDFSLLEPLYLRDFVATTSKNK